MRLNYYSYVVDLLCLTFCVPKCHCSTEEASHKKAKIFCSAQTPRTPFSLQIDNIIAHQSYHHIFEFIFIYINCFNAPNDAQFIFTDIDRHREKVGLIALIADILYIIGLNDKNAYSFLQLLGAIIFVQLNSRPHAWLLLMS